MRYIVGRNYNTLFWIIISIGLMWAIARTFSPFANQAPNELIINEFLASNGTGLTDEDGQYSDWIEIYNPGRSPVNLSGWSLTDDPTQPEKWTFPDVTLAKGDYLVIFASGKNRRSKEANIPLHTNFKLSNTGEFLGLYNILDDRWVDVVSPEAPKQSLYPQQFRDISYGRYGDGLDFGYLTTPTPGGSNDETVLWEAAVSGVEFSIERGFYDRPFELQLSTSTPGAFIRYTLDGSEPTESHGTLYAQPIFIEGTSLVRAFAYRPKFLPSRIETHTYVFLDDVLTQPPDPPGFPMTWGTIPKTWRGYVEGETVIADYEMDPEVVYDARYRQTIKNDLKTIPSVSIVTDIQYFTELYSNPREKGKEWERPVSIEFIDPSGQKPDTQVNAGLRIQGGDVRWEFIPKHAFRLFFRSEYGLTRLEYPLFDDSAVDVFDTLVFRGGGGYAGRPGDETRGETYIKDQWLRSSQREMSGVSPHGTFVHLYINGLYWGLYNVVERPDASFASSHLGGQEESWFAMNHNGPISGPLGRVQAYQDLFDSLGNTSENPEDYAAIQEFLDTTQFIDYVILNWYVGNNDWPDTNWYLTLQSPSGQANFFVWDGDGIFTGTGPRIDMGPTSPENLVKPIFERLIQYPDFKMEFADRVYYHLFNDGALTDAKAQARWLRISKLIDRAIVGESARWGDTRSDPSATRDDWLNAVDGILSQIEGNSAKFISLLREGGYYPDIDPPMFNQPSGIVSTGFNLILTNPDQVDGETVIYFTTDESDPRLSVTGAIAPSAMVFDGSLVLTKTTHIKARALSFASGMSEPEWSALNEAVFRAIEQDSQLRFSEIMYNPVGGGEYEFIELQNTGNSEFNLSGAYFDGIDFTFPSGAPPMAPNAFAVLVRNPVAFAERYPDIDIRGVYGGQLSNKGETIVLRDSNGDIVASVGYDDENGWPISPDGRGDSLVMHNMAGDPDDPNNWQASANVNGSPGMTEPTP